MRDHGRTWIGVSRQAVLQNVRHLRTVAGTAALMPMVKSNAYGHGTATVLQILEKQALWGFGVAYGQEALDLRQRGFQGRIAALSAWEMSDLPELQRHSVELVVHDFTTLKAVLQAARRGVLRIHLKLDTGTTRIGFRPEDLGRLRRVLLRRPKKIRIASVWTHFADSDTGEAQKTYRQNARFRAMSSGIPDAASLHAACTAALIRYPETRYDLCRPGIGVYGLWPSSLVHAWARRHLPALRLQPALTWMTHIAAIKTVPRGTSVGYAGTYVCRRKTQVAILPVGYGDGLRRAASNRGRVWVAGKSAPIIGRICMNLTMVDVTGLAVRPNMPTELIGPHISAEDHARWAETISYDIVTGLHPLIPRSVTS